jgi:hypothetical protein
MDRPSREYWIAQFNRIKGLPEDLGAERLEQLTQPAPACRKPKLGRRRPNRRAAATLARLLDVVNQHRHRVVGSAPKAQRALDSECAGLLGDWFLGHLEHQPITPRSPAPQLAPGLALVLGVLVDLSNQPRYGTMPADALLACFLSPRPPIRGFPAHPLQDWHISPEFTPLLKILARTARWRARIRRCMAWHHVSPKAQCVAFFLDTSPVGNAWGCSPAHRVRIIEALGARNPSRQVRSRL